jgi:hypothetical protein
MRVEGTRLILEEGGQRILIEAAPRRVPMAQMPEWAQVPHAYRMRGVHQLGGTNEFFANNDIGSGARVRIEVVTPGQDTLVLWGVVRWNSWDHFDWEEA